MTKTIETISRPSLLRHLAVIVYDLLLLASVLLFAAAIAVGLNAVVTDGQAITAGNPFFFIYLLGVSFLFYGWFWTHGGQTLGMRTWKVFLRSNNLHSVTWRQAFLRFTTALPSWLALGIGFWWQWFCKGKKSWPDLISNTYLQHDKNSIVKPLSRLS
ncbi:hypothetical protein LCGC14_0582350 [marine sediment metagenome]|uniref:RDD domain-containing protein n=1 Tax=marine sediment metagenome TaxID=412755 RepID=A0A0F9UP81_9ZZZZ|nr:RDD family protein [Methylophaga sp.]